jgi:hypothetical protein
LRTINGFKSVQIIESPINKGLANSIISGVTQVLEDYGKIIVLEDDLITSRNFLDFMNQGLDFYKDDLKIQSITGYTLDLPTLNGYLEDYYYGFRESSWGWGTWKNRWETTDWEVKGYLKFKYNVFQQIKFMRGGSDLPLMLKRQMNGKIDSWAIRWCFDQFRKGQLTVFPTISKVINIGDGANATHTKSIIKFRTELDIGDKTKFNFKREININNTLMKEFRKKFSFQTRIISRLSSLKIKYYSK